MNRWDHFLASVGLQRRSSPASPDYWVAKFFGGGGESITGAKVNETSAPSWTPIMSGMRFLSETIAALPFDVYQRTGNRGKKDLPDHPVARLMRNPNPEQDGFQFIELAQSHLTLWGNSYSQIIWNGGMEPIELWPINPDRVQMKRDRLGNIVYQINLPGDSLSSVSTPRSIPAEDMLHVRGFSRWGLIGERMSDVHRETIGLGLATEEFAARFFGKGANPSGVLEHPGVLSKEAALRLRESTDKASAGLTNAHRTMLLEEGMKWHQVTVDPEKAQFLELRTFQIQEAARILRIPPHLLYDLSRATFTNIEHQGTEVVIYTLLAWVKRWEARLNKTLISDKMKNTVYTKFNLNGLMRGDSQARAAFYASGRNNGWLSVNDIRELEDMNPVPDGDEYLQPVNMVPLGTEPAPAPAPNPAPAIQEAA